MTGGARARLRGQPDITERSAYGTVTGPAEAGYEVKQRTGAATAARPRQT
jgi:hypothetical protein